MKVFSKFVAIFNYVVSPGDHIVETSYFHTRQTLMMHGERRKIVCVEE